MDEPPTSADSRFTRLLDRLLNAAEASMAAGDLEPARATAEEVRAVDPDNVRAARILERLASRHHGPAGERALVTLLFSDLVGSTMLSERVEPEQLRDLFSFYRGVVGEAVERYSGSVIQFSGDGVLAGFGYPEPHEDDARRAVLAGLDLVVAMRDARSELERRVGMPAEVRVGIHTGRVVITDMSHDGAVAERDSIVGIAPNLASRIQQEAEPGMVVISDVTHQLVDADFYLRSLGVRQLKGISRPVEVYAVERPRYAAARFDAERYRKAGLVGREEPTRRLLAAWSSIRQSPRSPRGSVFLLSGEAGIGKSRLVVEVLDRVQASGGEVLGAGCLPYYTNVSLWPIARMLERAAGLTADGVDRRPVLVSYLSSLGLDPSRSLPFLGPLLGIEVSGYPAPELDPGAFLDETLGRILEWLSALAERSPHLLVVEDLHWADPSTLALLGRLATQPPGPLLTIATTRDTSLVPWRDAVPIIELGRLGGDAAADLVDNLSLGQDLSDDQRDFIVAQSEGVPLFIEEMTRSCLADHISEPMPLRLQELFTWRLKAPGIHQRVVQVAATVGPTFDSNLVSAVFGDEAEVTSQLELLSEQGVIERGGPTNRTYRFRHALMRDAAYETQVLDVRRQTHAQVADVMAAQGAEPALIAAHLDLAGLADRASPLYVAAAYVEQGRGAHPVAIRLLTRALELLETLPESRDRDVSELTMRMLRVLSVTATQGYAAPEVQSDNRRAEVLATALGARPEVLPSLIAIWSYWLVSGDMATARGQIDRLTDMVRDPAYSWFEPEVEACAGWQDLFEGHLASAWEHLHHAVTGFGDRPPDQAVSPFWPLPHDPIAVSLIALYCVSAMRGDAEEAERWEREALRRGEDVGFPRGPISLAFIKTFGAWIRRFLGDHETSWQLGSEVVAIGREHGYVFWSTLGSAYTVSGQPGSHEHRELLRQTMAALRLMGQESFSAVHLAYLAQLHAATGEVDRARELVEEAIEVVHKSGEHVHLAELLRQRAAYTLDRGADVEDAVADLTEALRVTIEQDARVARLRAAVDLARVPVAYRPTGWRSTLSDARGALSPTLRTADTAAADELLAG